MLNIKKYLPAIQISAISLFISLAQVASAEAIKNPLGNVKSLEAVIANLIKGLLGLTALVAIGFIVYGGFLYITAAGDDSQIKKGKEAVTGAIIGIIVIGLAYSVVAFVIGAMGAGGSTGGSSGRLL